MSYNYYSAPSTDELKNKAAKSTAKLMKKGHALLPVMIQGNTIARSWWGKAWIDNLLAYADYSNRLGRGRSYVKNGMVLHLAMLPQRIDAIVQGSRAAPYTLSISIDALSEKRLSGISKFCGERISSLGELLEGKFPQEMAQVFTDRKLGLFPAPAEIHFSCSCPDYADMCKHVAAALCGVGARLDSQPELFFLMRGIPTEKLLRTSVDQRVAQMLKAAEKKSHRVLSDYDILALFGKLE